MKCFVQEICDLHFQYHRTVGASELRAILQKRKEFAERPDDNFGARPSFMPETPPDYSPPESEGKGN